MEIFSELNRNGSTVHDPPKRGPVLLLLGGGMAAGKSTVREIIGHDDFWSKVENPSPSAPSVGFVINSLCPVANRHLSCLGWRDCAPYKSPQVIGLALSTR